MKLFGARQIPACALACALITPTGFAAVPASEPTAILTLSQAIAATVAQNPDLRATAYELKAADAGITQAGLRPNPEVSLEVNGLAGSGIARDAEERQVTLTLSQTLELGDKRGRRINVAASNRELVGIEQQARELDVLAEVTRRFIEVASAQERLQLAREASGLAERTAKAIAVRVEAARTPQAELSRAQIAVTRAHADERQAESALRGARRLLTAMWGNTEPRFDSARADLLKLTPLEPFETLQQRIDRNPDFVRFASEARLREAELRLAQAQSRPNLTVGVGLRRFQATNDVGVTLGFSMAIPMFDRNQGAIAQARVRREQTGAQEEAARIRAQAALFALYQQLVANRDRLATLQSEALPEAQAALDQTQTGYERGRFSYLELAVAQQELVSLRSAVIDTATDYYRLTAEIERLTSESLTTATHSQDLP
jgi:cobalt-zinc-cadmium efflux system outer membrane protein